MSEIATKPVEVIDEIRSHAFQEQLAAALPPGITPERFARITVTALLDDQARQRDTSKQLLACDRLSLYQAVIKCAQDGLLPDGRQAALVKRGDKVVYQPMVAGLRAIAAEYGWTIRGTAVRQTDEFDWQEEPPSLFHKVSLGDRGELVYAYAVARHKDGRREQRVMTRDEILKRQASATSKNVWESWPDEMWAKTAVRDLFQDLPLDPAERARINRVLEMDPVEALYVANELSASAPLGATAAETETETSSLDPAALSVPPPDDEPGPAEEPTPPSEAPAVASPTDEINAAAEAAAGYVPPNGKFSAKGANGPKTLQEIMESEKGGEWFAWALGKIDAPAAHRDAVRAYARVFAPTLYQEQIAKEELA